MGSADGVMGAQSKSLAYDWKMNMVSVLREGTFFAPDLAPVENLPAGLAVQFAGAVAVGGIAALLSAPAEGSAQPPRRDRS
jgi:hypothetical protein